MEEITVDGFAAEFPDLAEKANGIAFSKDGARAYFVTLTPEMAKRVLEFNTDNYRKVRPKHIRFLKDLMATRQFLMNGDPLRVDNRKIVSDGQHRLIALSEQEPFTEVEFLIVDNLDPNTIPTMDANALQRSYIDYLRRQGWSNATNRSALTVLYHKWVNDRPLDSAYATSIQMLEEVAEPVKDRISWAVSNSTRHRKLKGIQPALIALSYLILGDVSELAIKQLFIGASEGENIHRGMPAYTLRDRLLTDYNDNVKRTKAEQMWFVFRTFSFEYKNTMRNPDDHLTIHRLYPPKEGVSTRDLKEMLVMER